MCASSPLGKCISSPCPRRLENNRGFLLHLLTRSHARLMVVPLQPRAKKRHNIPRTRPRERGKSLQSSHLAGRLPASQAGRVRSQSSRIFHRTKKLDNLFYLIARKQNSIFTKNYRTGLTYLRMKPYIRISERSCKLAIYAPREFFDLFAPRERKNLGPEPACGRGT